MLYSVLDGLPGVDRAAVLHDRKFRLFGWEDLVQRSADHKLAAIAGMARPGGIGILVDDATVRVDRQEGKVHGGVLENRAVSFARTAQLLHRFAQRAGAIHDFALQPFSKAAERQFGPDALADVAPVDRDAVARRPNIDRHPDAGSRRRRFEGDHLPGLANLAEHLFVHCAEELGKPFPDDAADHLIRADTPEFKCSSIGIDDAPLSIEGIECVSHAFQDGLRVSRQGGRSGLHSQRLFRGDQLRPQWRSGARHMLRSMLGRYRP